MKNAIKNFILNHYPKFHKTTVFLACSFLIVSCFGFELSTMPYLAGIFALEFSEGL